MAVTICGPPCKFKISSVRWDLLTLTFDRLTFIAYGCLLRGEINILYKNVDLVALTF